jgi:hypothetical protein
MHPRALHYLATNHINMPRKPSPTTALLQELHAARVAANQARRAEEAPIRAARRKLVERLASATRAVHRVNEKLSRIVYHTAFRNAPPSLFSFELKPADQALEVATAMFKTRLLDLMTFDAANGIEGADYPTCPELDRAATEAAAKADYNARMAQIRARMERDGYAPRRTTP